MNCSFRLDPVPRSPHTSSSSTSYEDHWRAANSGPTTPCLRSGTYNADLSSAVPDACRTMWLPVGAIFGRLEGSANDHHEEILVAIEEGNAEVAASTMQAHINDTRHTVGAWLKR